MLNAIRTNLNALEYMIFFWQSVLDREKVGEDYLAQVAALPEMNILYSGDEFNAESVRKVLSAITNRERLSDATLTERQFWNNNMWIVEDPEMFGLMIAPIKSLSPGSLCERLNAAADISFDSVEIVFIPAFKEEAVFGPGRLYINFFKVMVDMIMGTGDVTIGSMSLEDFIEAKILEMDGVKLK
ncbi:MAG: hypothetical protein LBU86_02040 [Oscillospiraceae bacterium]|nr:hypothetical protein [Oscillospiraceae bacterium]